MERTREIERRGERMEEGKGGDTEMRRCEKKIDR